MAHEGTRPSVKSWRLISLGAVIALAVPMSYLVLARLIQTGIAAPPTGSLNDALKSLGLNVTVELVLAPLGIWIIGRGARLHRAWAWLVLVALALPVLAAVWFLCYATLGGATGSPF